MDSFSENNTEFMKNNKFIVKSQQRLRCDKHNVMTEEVY